MNKSTVEELAYFLKEAKEKNMPAPIFFLGAGASKSGGILLANEIIKDIKNKYSDNPKIKNMKDADVSYSKIMECIGPNARNLLLKSYIENAKINVTHIYIAQLMMHDYADYVLTVNFDNLMQRALALYNEFPPTYDMAILKDLTTTTFREKSIVYLHGQHHGLWLLNTTEEMEKVKEIIPPILNGIRNQRPWIFIGYSGEDPIFDYIKKLGRFDNGLYWVTYYDSKPSSKVVKELLSKPNTNSFLIEGFDADSFMLKLNKELGLPEPEIIDKPFTSLKSMIKNIVDIDDEKHFKGVKERLEISKKQVDEAIQQFEFGKLEPEDSLKKNTELELFKKEIIDVSINEDFNVDNINQLLVKAKKFNDKEINSLFSSLYNNWGTKLWQSSKDITNVGNITYYDDAKSLNESAIEKFKIAQTLDPENSDVQYGWAVALGNNGFMTKNKASKKKLFLEASLKYEHAIKLEPNNSFFHYEYASVLGQLALLEEGKNRKKLIEDSGKRFLLAHQLGEKRVYNLACFYAIQNIKDKAFEYLTKSLENNEYSIEFVLSDNDWSTFIKDKEFKNIITRFKQ